MRARRRVLPPASDVAATLRQALAAVPLTPVERRLHHERQCERILPLFRFVTLLGAMTYLGFAGWDLILGGVAGLLATLPMRFGFTVLFLAVWLASFHERVAAVWPALWSGVVLVVTAAVGLAIGLTPRGMEMGVAGLLYAGAANVLVAPHFIIAVANYLIITIVGIGSYAVFGASPTALANATFFLVTFSLLFGLVSWWVDQSRRRSLLLEQALSVEQARRDALLAAMLPAGIAERLHAGEQPIADAVPTASIVFVDVVGYSRLTRELAPGELVELLEQAFAVLDFLAAEHRLTKIKTIGDAYVAAAGVADAETSGPLEAAAFALAARQALRELGRRLDRPLDVHAGIATGPVTAGVIGEQRPQFDLWGLTVNQASRLQAAAPPGAVQIDAATASAIGEHYRLERQGPTAYRGIGVIDVWRLFGVVQGAAATSAEA